MKLAIKSSTAMTKLLLSALALSVSVTASASDESTQAATPAAQKESGGLLKDFDTLGGNDVLLDKARALTGLRASRSTKFADQA